MAVAHALLLLSAASALAFTTESPDLAAFVVPTASRFTAAGNRAPAIRPAASRVRAAITEEARDVVEEKNNKKALNLLMAGTGRRELLLTTVIPAVGACIATLMFLAPLADIQSARALGTLGAMNPIPLVAIVGNCAAWLGYSFATSDKYVFAANMPGLLLGLFYTMSAIAVAAAPTRLLLEKLLLAYAAVVGASGFIASTKRLGSPQKVFGYVANGLLILYYAAPLSVLAKVIATRSAASLHLGLSAMSALNGALWCTYGLATKDAFVWAPNAFGVLVSSAQLLLKAIV